MMTDRERIRIVAQELMVSTRVIEKLADGSMLEGRSVADLIGLGVASEEKASGSGAQPSAPTWQFWRRTRR